MSYQSNKRFGLSEEFYLQSYLSRLLFKNSKSHPKESSVGKFQGAKKIADVITRYQMTLKLFFQTYSKRCHHHRFG